MLGALPISFGSNVAPLYVHATAVVLFPHAKQIVLHVVRGVAMLLLHASLLSTAHVCRLDIHVNA
jgi:hypothetical protein